MNSVAKKRTEEVRQYGRARIKGLVMLLVILALLFAMAAVGYCTTPAPSLTIDFDVEAMFSWTQIIISALMPIVYVLMGIGLGFLIINNLKNAFVGSMH